MVEQFDPQNKKELVLEDSVPKIAFGIMEEWLINGNEINNFGSYVKDIENVYQDLRESDPKAYKEFMIKGLRSLVAQIALKLVERLSSDRIAKNYTYLNRIGVFQSLLEKLTNTVNEALGFIYGSEGFEKVLVPDLYLHLDIPKNKESKPN